ncbi:N-acetylneuraminate lyase [Propionivibrio soli]|uniref:N-acetylneuraminate lyase n=1 Tax=Propionivibrio soli TaxID=2976531 RepID=UPI0021E7A525|nr:N-acetylneuraminate lyase [Propionivibrio soli]
MKNLNGIYPALPTPMAPNGEVNYSVLKTLVDFEIDQGVDGLYVGGSTAESFLLTEDERKCVAETVLDHAAGRVNVIVHTGAGGTDAARRLTLHAKANGADAISSVPPIYFKYTTEEVIAYYLDLIESSDMPLVVYNIPAFTGINMTQGPIRELFKHPRVVALKHTNTNMYELERVLAHNPKLIALNGYDEAFLSGLSMGATGMIGSTVNFMARKFIILRDAFQAGRNAEAFRLQREANEIIETMVEVGVFSAVKYAMTLRGVDCGACRGPFKPLQDNDKKRVRAILEKNLGEAL